MLFCYNRFTTRKGTEIMNYKKQVRPERVIQFGEGGFLRGFVDWILQILNEETAFNGSAVVVQPIEQGMCDMLQKQDCVYKIGRASCRERV